MPTMYDYSRSFFPRHYRPDNVILCLVGDVDADTVMPLVEAHRGDWEAGYTPPEVPPEPPQREKRRVEVAYEGGALPYLELGYRFDGFDPTDATRAAVEPLVELTLESASETDQRLVLEEQLVEVLNAEANLNRDPRLIDVYARIKNPARVDAVIEAIDATVAAYRRAPPDERRVAPLKSRLRNEFLMGLQTPDSTDRRLARMWG